MDQAVALVDSPQENPSFKRPSLHRVRNGSLRLSHENLKDSRCLGKDLKESIKNGDIPRVHSLLQEGVSLEEREGESPLSLARLLHKKSPQVKESMMTLLVAYGAAKKSKKKIKERQKNNKLLFPEIFATPEGEARRLKKEFLDNGPPDNPPPPPSNQSLLLDNPSFSSENLNPSPEEKIFLRNLLEYGGIVVDYLDGLELLEARYHRLFEPGEPYDEGIHSNYIKSLDYFPQFMSFIKAYQSSPQARAKKGDWLLAEGRHMEAALYLVGIEILKYYPGKSHIIRQTLEKVLSPSDEEREETIGIRRTNSCPAELRSIC
jgi:hypothetical protein